MKPRGENVEYDRLRVRYDELAASASFMSDRIASLEAEVNEQARLNGMGGSREAKLLARVGQLEAALTKIRILKGALFDAVMIATEAMGSVAETSSRFPRAMLDPDFKAETAAQREGKS